MKRRAVVLLSGGVDSSTALAVALQRGFEVYALTVDYGQRHRIEIEAASKITAVMNVSRHEILTADIRRFGGSALLSGEELPESRDPSAFSAGIPRTYVPARNTIMLSLALAWAETLGARHIFIGVNSIDYSGYPDCRLEYITAFERMANLATRAGVMGDTISIEAPFIAMTKAEIIKLGVSLGVDFSLTHSCYAPAADGLACGRCESCIIRKRGFIEADIPDPTRYNRGVTCSATDRPGGEMHPPC